MKAVQMHHVVTALQRQRVVTVLVHKAAVKAEAMLTVTLVMQTQVAVLHAVHVASLK